MSVSGQQHGELVAAGAEEPIVGARQLAHRLAIDDEHLVAGGMAVAVVDDLEVIEVHEHQAERGAAAPRSVGHLPGQLFLEGSGGCPGR